MAKLPPILLFGVMLILGWAVTPVAGAQTTDRTGRLDRFDRSGDRIRDRPAVRDRSDDRILQDSRTVRGRVERADSAAVESVEDQSRDAESPVVVFNDRNERVRRGEVLALNISDEALDVASQNQLLVIRRRALRPGDELVVLRSQTFLPAADIIDILQAADPDGVFAPNHVYDPSQEVIPSGAHRAAVEADLAGNCNIGMIDGLPDTTLSQLAGVIRATRRFGDQPSGASSHGTAVALILADSADRFEVGAKLLVCAADVSTGGSLEAIAADALAEAIGWQEGRKVAVLNISLAGPANLIVEHMVSRFLEGGGQIVAAVGNGGPLSQNIYPAAYDGVIGVTATDGMGHIYPLATTGVHVDVAARGVDLQVESLAMDKIVSGTSYAAPIVTAWMLRQLLDVGAYRLPNLVDLGDAGRDDIFGYGKVPDSIKDYVVMRASRQ